MSTAFQDAELAFQEDAFQIDAVQTGGDQLLPGGAAGSTGPTTYRVFVHYAKEYPEETRTPVAEAAAQALEPPGPEPVPERPQPARRPTVFTPAQPSAEEVLLAEITAFEQMTLLITAEIQADLLGIKALQEQALEREEDEAIELFLLLES